MSIYINIYPFKFLKATVLALLAYLSVFGLCESRDIVYLGLLYILLPVLDLFFQACAGLALRVKSEQIKMAMFEKNFTILRLVTSLCWFQRSLFLSASQLNS